MIIKENYKAPLTAKRYVDGLLSSIEELKIYAEVLPKIKSLYIRKRYGFGVRRLNYKKVSVLYIIENGVVYILKIIPSSLIKNL